MCRCEHKTTIAGLSNAGLIELLQMSVQAENEKIDDIHSLVIVGRNQLQEAGHESASIFSMIDRVLESARDRDFIDCLIAEAMSRTETAPFPRAATKSCRKADAASRDLPARAPMGRA